MTQTPSRPAPVTPLPSRGAFGLMFDRVFGALFWGKMFAVVAVWTHGLVAAIVMYEATRSALMVGLVGVAQFMPQLILAPTSGKWADTGNPARQILLGRVFCVIGSGSIAVWMFAEPGLQGDRSSAGTKPATMETGAEIQVPLFINTGDKLKVDSRDGSYLGRVNA